MGVNIEGGVGAVHCERLDGRVSKRDANAERRRHGCGGCCNKAESGERKHRK